MLEINPMEHIIPKFDEPLKDIIDHKYTHYLFSGGRGGTKSTFIPIAIILLILLNKNSHAIIFRKVGNTIRDSVFANICFAVGLLGLSDYFKIKKSPLEVIFKSTDQRIMFRGSDEPAKIKSIRPPFGYFGITWFEELDQFHGREEIRVILQSTMRGKGGKFWNFESFNPPKSRDHWANLDVLKENNDRLHTKVSYLDVPVEWLSERFVIEAKQLQADNPVAYEHEYMGVATGTGGAVFDNVVEQRITKEVINTFDNIKQGIDYGFSIDPAVWCEMHYDKKQKTLYIFNEIYEIRLFDEAFAEKIKEKRINTTIITADSHDSKTNAKMNTLGLSVYPAKKGPDSRDFGFKFLQGLTKIVIDKIRCPNAYREFFGYEYMVDRHGNFISEYPKKNDHVLDAVRYAMENEMLETRAITANLRFY
ncbi:MAG: PBSX family phage terminase large subunit [Defluviitaleaceae bacterium]|nr:PBSX family phage terminase large subunit [Defluviitaleaceae bacterium]